MGNLHLVTGYAGSEHITSADAGSFNAAIVGSGSYVLNRGNAFAISVISNNQVRIADGDILLQGRHIRLNENTYVDLTIENGTQGMLRNDLIVCRYTKNSGTGVEQADLVVIKGTSAASNPVDPAHNEGNIINGDMTADFPLYRIPLNGLNVGTPVALFDNPVKTIAELLAENNNNTSDLNNHAENTTVHITDTERTNWNGKATTKTFTASVDTTWTADSTNGGYTKTITVSGVLATDNPIYDVVLGTDIDANAAYLEAFALVTRLTTAANQIVLWANESRPTSAFTLKLQVVR